MHSTATPRQVEGESPGHLHIVGARLLRSSNVHATPSHLRNEAINRRSAVDTTSWVETVEAIAQTGNNEEQVNMCTDLLVNNALVRSSSDDQDSISDLIQCGQSALAACMPVHRRVLYQRNGIPGGLDEDGDEDVSNEADENDEVDASDPYDDDDMVSDFETDFLHLASDIRAPHSGERERHNLVRSPSSSTTHGSGSSAQAASCHASNISSPQPFRNFAMTQTNFGEEGNRFTGETECSPGST